MVYNLPSTVQATSGSGVGDGAGDGAGDGIWHLRQMTDMVRCMYGC